MSRFAHMARAAAAAALTAAGVGTAVAQTPAPSASSTPVSPNELFRSGQPIVTPGPCPPDPCAPVTPLTPAPGMPFTPPAPTSSPISTDAGLFDGPGVPTEYAGAGAGPTTPQGGPGAYIDNAVPVTQFRLRFDSAYGNNRPDRAEFFYAKCGCFRGLGQLDANGPGRPDANSPGITETNVDYQALAPYLELALAPRFSVFTTVPVRFINPTRNRNAAGLSDVSFGAKYAFIYDPCTVMSLQMTVTTPTGDESRGLGTGVTWLEPALLYQRQMSARWQLFGMVKDSIFLERQSDFTGNVLSYGVGSSYVVASGCWGYVAPVGELVGWTVLNGKEFANDAAGRVLEAGGDTIVNAKFGVRIGFGAPQLGRAYPTRSDFYIGYGRALTGEVWYKDILRLEYRLNF